MPAQDGLWLTMDRPTGWMVVDTALVLDAVVAVASVRAVFADLVQRHPVLTCRAERTPPGWSWVPDPRFDLDRHVRAVDLGPTATIADVQQFMGRERARRLDPARPLWVASVVAPVEVAEGVRGCVVAVRIHHAIADGVRLTQLLLGALAPIEAVVRPAGTGSHRADDRAGDRTSTLAAGTSTTDAVRGAVRAAASPVRTLRRLVRHPDLIADAVDVVDVVPRRVPGGALVRRTWHDVVTATKFAVGQSPPTSWSGAPGVDKLVVWSAPTDLAPIAAAARASGTTVNDVLVAGLAGGLRDYLTGHDRLVDDVVWMVPVNLDPFDARLPTALGNRFALVLLDLPLTGPTAARRLVDVRRRMARIKSSDEPGATFALQRALALVPGPVGAGLIRFFADKCVGVLSNVPGPRARLTLAGATVRQIVGFAPCSGRQAMTVTIFSYAGSVTVGVAADAGLVPDPRRIVDAMLAELRVLCSRPAPADADRE